METLPSPNGSVSIHSARISNPDSKRSGQMQGRTARFWRTVMRINSIGQIAVVCFVAGFAVCGAMAQEFRATISGRVTDPSGAVVVKAKVTAVEASSKTTYTAQ